MAPESTIEYYREIIRSSHEKGWEKRYPQTIIYSLNFEEFFEPLSEGADDRVLEVLSAGIESLDAAGADFALLASNTPHKYFEPLAKDAPIPLRSIVDATARAGVEEGYEDVGLLGTLHTTNGSFYPSGFDEYGLTVHTPSQSDKEWMHEKIFAELTNGVHTEETKAGLIEIVETMVEDADIDAVALACTELPLVLDSSDLPVPILNTTALHARDAFEAAVESESPI